MNEIIQEINQEGEIFDIAEYNDDIEVFFSDVDELIRPIIEKAKENINTIEKGLYKLPSFIALIKASIPEETLKVVFTDDQKELLKKGAVKLMSKKNGSLAANLVNPQTQKIVSTVNLEKVSFTPELNSSLINYTTQIQMAQIAEAIEQVQHSVEEVRKGLENDRLAIAYSCKQKLLQAMSLNSKDIKILALMNVINSAEDCRNSLMLSQKENIFSIKNEPEDFFGKIARGSKTEKVEQRIDEIRESLIAINLVSFSEALAYQEMGENNAAKISMQHYCNFIENNYLNVPGLVERLDMLDSSPINYWTEIIPNITKKIHELPVYENVKMIKGEAL